MFKALADPTRRELLDELFLHDGQTLVALASRFAMTRVAVAKHLRLLEDAGLVTAHRAGREKRHYLNPVPIRQVYDRWVSKYTEAWAAGLVDLKHDLEGNAGVWLVETHGMASTSREAGDGRHMVRRARTDCGELLARSPGGAGGPGSMGGAVPNAPVPATHPYRGDGKWRQGGKGGSERGWLIRARFGAGIVTAWRWSLLKVNICL